MSSHVIMSSSKWEFLMKIGLDGDKPEHQALYWQMKNEAIRVYNDQLRDRSALRREHQKAAPPYTANQFTEDAFNTAIRTIEEQASERTLPLYAKGRNDNGPNWVIRWILYHVCRYRDGRNKKAQSKNFHDDDNLEGGRGSGGSSTGGRSSAGSISQTGNAYYDAARDSRRAPGAH
ncbi:hypothetical protein JMJ35_003586 [Cladonia borealis]|uniref:Uncharacterized protein n=1 Tax=Cladonia borealis TaxID=184061 RepID=A0AA39R4X8_9LECA|nr:hypothetical protein JMJ35_003586 [Cladonia borealis]